MHMSPGLGGGVCVRARQMHMASGVGNPAQAMSATPGTWSGVPSPVMGDIPVL